MLLKKSLTYYKKSLKKPKRKFPNSVLNQKSNPKSHFLKQQNMTAIFNKVVH